MRKINVGNFKLATRSTGREITAAWDLVEPGVRAEIRERALTRAAAATPVIPETTVGYPRLRGAAALVAAPVFAAPQVA